MRAVYMRLDSLLLLVMPLLLPLRLSTHLTEAAAVNGGGDGGGVRVDINAAVDKEVAPVGVVKTDLLSLEQEIGGNPAAAAEQGAAARKARSFLLSLGAGPAWLGGSLGYGFAGYGGYGYPGYGYGGYNYNPYYSGYGSGYYPGVFGYQKIIIG